MTALGADSTIEDVAATVSETLASAGITAVLSGGAAVQIYSSGLYVSRDLDFVSPATLKEIAAALVPLGFRRSEARHFIHDECMLTLDLNAIRRWSEREGHAQQFAEFERRVPDQ